MSAEEPKPVEVPAAEPAAEPAPVVDEPVAAEPAVAAAEEPKAEEPKPVEETPAAAAAVAAPAEPTEAAEAPKEEAVKSVEPKESGYLHYNAPSNFLKEYLPLPPKKVFFWLGEDPVDPAKLKTYLAKGKEAASSTAAWASQTGKGLLFFNKHGEDKDTPSGALNLAEAEDIKEAGSNEFAFKLHGHRHKFVAENSADRDSWLSAVKKIAEDAKVKKDELLSSESYKDALAKLKPAPVAAAAAAVAAAAAAATVATKSGEEVPKKSTDLETAGEDEGKKSAKSRSRSRGPLAGLFKTKKEEKAEEPKTTEAGAATEPVADATPAEPATETEAVAPAEESKEETETPKESKKDRRQSRFESFFASVASVTKPKKEGAAESAKAEETKAEDATPAEAAVAADPVAAAAPIDETPKIEEPVKDEEVKKEEVAPTPTKERKPSILTGLKGFAQKVRSPSSEQPPAVAEAGKASPAVEGSEAPAATAEAAAPVAEETTATNGEPSKAEKRRSSFFNFAAINTAINKKKEGATTPAATEELAKPAEEPEAAKPAEETAAPTETPVEEKTDGAAPKETKESPIVSLSRRFSKAIRGEKAKKEPKAAAVADAAKEEPVKAAEEAPEVAVPAESKVEQIAKAEEPATPAVIGDVVPEAVTVGAPPASAPVSAAA